MLRVGFFFATTGRPLAEPARSLRAQGHANDHFGILDGRREAVHRPRRPLFGGSLSLDGSGLNPMCVLRSNHVEFLTITGGS
jgi:hypothetical protein